MDKVNEILGLNGELTNEQIMSIFNLIGNRGDIVIIKNDGLRKDNNFSVIITSGNNGFEAIRFDANTLSDGFKKAFAKYVQEVDMF